MTSPSLPLRESYAPSLDPTLLSTLIAATPVTFPLRLQLEIARDLTLPMAMDLLLRQVTTPALLPLTSEIPPSAAFLLLLPGSLEPLWRVDLPTSELPLPRQTSFDASPLYPQTPTRQSTPPGILPPPPPFRRQSLAPPVVIPAPNSYPAIPAAVAPISNLTVPNTSVQDVTPLPQDITSRAAQPASTSPTKELIRTMALSDSDNGTF